jgi:hypothetical protein
MRRSKQIACTLSAVAIAVVAAGCGGGPQQVSAAELVEQGDEVCRDLQERFAEIQAQPPANAPEGADQAGQLLDAAAEAQSELRDLEPPEDIRPAYDRYLDARDEVSDLLKQGKDAASDQDGDAFGRAQQQAADGAPERKRLAAQLGFKVCSQNPQGL